MSLIKETRLDENRTVQGKGGDMRLESHREAQEFLINRVYRFLSYIVFPVLLINLSRYFILGWIPSFNYYIIAGIFLFVISINAPRLPYLFKVLFLIVFFISLAVSTGSNFGMVSFIAEFLILTVFIGVTFLEKKSALMIHFICGSILFGCAVLCMTGILPLVPDFEQHTNSLESWSSYLVTFLLMTTIIISIGGNIGNLLSEKIKALEEKNKELLKANEEVKKLQGILPICSNCSKIRDDKGYWNRVESYIESRSGATFSHSICDECYEKLYGNEKWFIKP